MTGNKETVNSQAVEALTKIFKERRWDSTAPRLLSEWEGFYYDGSTFGVKIESEDGKTTSVCFLIDSEKDTVAAVIERGWEEHNLQIKICPVDLVWHCLSVLGQDREGAIEIRAFWAEQRYTITRSGRLLVSGRIY